MKKSQEFRTISLAELRSRVVEFKKELLKLNVQVATGANVANAGRVKQLKKNLARAATIITAREGKVE